MIKAFIFNGVLGGWLYWTLFGVILGVSVNVWMWIVVSYSLYLTWLLVSEIIDEWQERKEVERAKRILDSHTDNP